MRKKEEVKVYFDEIENTYAPNSKRWKFVYSWLDTLIFALAVVLVLFTLLFRTASVVGPSMKPTLKSGDRLLIKSVNIGYERGDIVVISQPDQLNDMVFSNEPLVKRIIAVEGDVIDINIVDGSVKVNGEKLDEPYVYEPIKRMYDMAFPTTVPEGCVFVMGDNRNDSRDSRSIAIGFIDTRYILGKAVFRTHPLKDWKIY